MKSPKVILITGASSGIGRAVAEALVQQGHLVFGAHRSTQDNTLAGVTYLPLDLHASASIQDCVQAVIQQAGKIDVLINNAGSMGIGAACEEIGVAGYRELFETNFFGVVALCNAVLPFMRAQGSGLIINVSSVAGLVPVPPYFSAYAASKHALEAYSESLRAEVAPLGIQVAVSEPGYFNTNLHQSVRKPAAPISDYAALREQAAALNEYCIRTGLEVGLLAKQISQIVETARPRLRYFSGSNVAMLVLTRRIFPQAVLDFFESWLFLSPLSIRASDDEATINRKLGPRRLFLDARLLTRAISLLLWGCGVLVGLLVLSKIVF